MKRRTILSTAKTGRVPRGLTPRRFTQGTYHEQVRDLELGDCVQVSGIVTNVDGDSIRMEAGELE